jgi:DinB superfamily
LQAQHLQLVQEAIDSATAGMTEEQLTWHPDGKWSSAQILEHLSLTFVNAIKGLNQLLAEGRPALRKSTLKERLAVLVTVKAGYIPGGRKAPESVVPKGMDSREVQGAIRANILTMDRLGKQCEERFDGREKVFLHPILGPLTVQELFKFHRTHTLHHMRQVRALRGHASDGK